MNAPHEIRLLPYNQIHAAQSANTNKMTMQAANRLQRALRTGSGLTFGAWQMLPGSNQSRTIARCGFDWVLVDTEHGNIDGNEIQPLVSAPRRSR